MLKKKFDDIFEATKYTKALDQIKSIKKDQTIELKVDRERLIALKSDRDRAVKVEGMIEKLERDIAEKTGKTEELDVQIETYTAHNKEFYEKAVEHNRILSEVQNLQVKKELTQSALDDLRRSLTELSGTREQLEQQRDNFAREADAKARQKQGYRAEIDEVDEQRYAVGKKLAKAQTDKGVLQADLDVSLIRFAGRPDRGDSVDGGGTARYSKLIASSPTRTALRPSSGRPPEHSVCSGHAARHSRLRDQSIG